MMIDRRIIKKYYELLLQHDYDIKLSEDLKSCDETIENFNEILLSILVKYSRDELVSLLLQATKRDFSSGIALGESDEIFDEIQKYTQTLD